MVESIPANAINKQDYPVRLDGIRYSNDSGIVYADSELNKTAILGQPIAVVAPSGINDTGEPIDTTWDTITPDLTVIIYEPEYEEQYFRDPIRLEDLTK